MYKIKIKYVWVNIKVVYKGSLKNKDHVWKKRRMYSQTMSGDDVQSLPGKQGLRLLLGKTNALIKNAVPPSHPFSHPLLLTMTSYGVETLVSLGQLSSLSPLLVSCSLPAYQPLRVARWGGRELQCCVNAPQRCPKNWCVTNTFLATNKKYSTMRAAVGKVKPISARSSISTYNIISILESY